MKIKLFESFSNDNRDWRLSDKMKSKIDSEIKNVLIELVDNGFEIEIDHFAKKIAEQNSILVSVHKISNNERFNTNEVKDNFLVLWDYMNEFDDVKISYDYEEYNDPKTSITGSREYIQKVMQKEDKHVLFSHFFIEFETGNKKL